MNQKFGIAAGVFILSVTLGWFGTSMLHQSGLLPLAQEIEDFAGSDPDEAVAEFLDLLDELAAHPDDPDKPDYVSGVYDDELAQLHPEDAAFLLEQGISLARERLGTEPRYAFEVGRVALFHGDPGVALDLLSAAADAGSAAAAGYLGAMAEDPVEAEALLQQAVAGGFAPANEALASLKDEIAQAEAEARQAQEDEERRQNSQGRDAGFDSFNRPDIIKALTSDQTGSIDRNTLLIYISKMNSVLTEPSAWFRAGAGFDLELDPTLTPRLNYILSTDPTLMRDLSSRGLNAIWGALSGMAKERQQQQQNGRFDPAGEISAFNKGMVGGMHNFALLTSQAEQDGKRLLLLYQQDPHAFRQVYGGIKRFVDRLN